MAILWDLSDRAHRYEYRQILNGHTGAIRACTWGPKAGVVATASMDGSARVWDAKNGGIISVLTGHTSSVEGCSFDPRDRSLVTVSRDGTIYIWGCTEGLYPRWKLIRSFNLGPEQHCGRFNSNGELFASGSVEGGLSLWRGITGAAPVSLGGLQCQSAVRAVAFSSTGSQLGVLSEGIQ